MASGIQIQKLNPRLTQKVPPNTVVTKSPTSTGSGASSGMSDGIVASTLPVKGTTNALMKDLSDIGSPATSGTNAVSSGIVNGLTASLIGMPSADAEIQNNMGEVSSVSDTGSNVSTSVSGTPNPAYDNTAYQNALAQAIEAYRNAGQSKLDNLRNNYMFSQNNLQNAYNQKADALKQNNDEALRQAYINYMMGIKNLSQDLSNAGINGGAAESLLANMYNNYGNNRASIQNQTRGNLADLAANFNEGMANLTSGYNNNYADALNDMYSRIAGLQADYANDEANRNYQLQLANAKANASNTTANGGAKLDNNTYERAMATLQNMYSGKQYQKMLDYLDNLGVDSSTGNSLLADAVNLSPEELYGLLNQANQPLNALNDPLGIIGSGLSMGDIYSYLTNPTVNKMAAMRGRN